MPEEEEKVEEEAPAVVGESPGIIAVPTASFNLNELLVCSWQFVKY